jgi:hypothetical protein
VWVYIEKTADFTDCRTNARRQVHSKAKNVEYSDYRVETMLL